MISRLRRNRKELRDRARRLRPPSPAWTLPSVAVPFDRRDPTVWRGLDEEIRTHFRAIAFVGRINKKRRKGA